MSERILSVRIKNNWPLPKYYLGQLVKQGEILAIRRLPENSEIALDFGNEPWAYYVMQGQDSDCLLILGENEIIPLSEKELQSKIQSEIDLHQNKIAVLSEQLQKLETIKPKYVY
ncbi:hypothetical protein LC612_37075 [Nostoc sp. CHAB 5834]|nr:hypothetical protein [Nostoc sp. CHAB 5834]